MRYLMFLLLISGVSCSKTKNTHANLNPVLQKNFYYKKGSYWVYQDSLSGVIDSFYLQSSNIYTSTDPSGNSYDEMDVTLGRIGTANDTEYLFLYFIKNTLSCAFSRPKDVIESQIYIDLFNYPYSVSTIDRIGIDHGNVVSINNNFTIDGILFSDTTVISTHSNYADAVPLLLYNDVFYINNAVGFTKIVFNHPQDSVNRILELKRYNIVK